MCVCVCDVCSCVLPVPVAKNDGGPVYEAKIEDGKLYYENRA